MEQCAASAEGCVLRVAGGLLRYNGADMGVGRLMNEGSPAVQLFLHGEQPRGKHGVSSA